MTTTNIKELSKAALHSKIQETTNQLCQNTTLSAHLVEIKLRELEELKLEMHSREKKLGTI